MSTAKDHVMELKNTLANLSEFSGSKYLLELITHPSQPIHATELRYLFNQPIIERPEYKPESNHQNGFSTSALTNPLDETPIQFCDQKTIDAVKQRLAKIQAIKAEAREWNDLSRLDDIISEEEQLIDYLRKAFDRKGQPRYLRNKSFYDYSCIKKSLNRIIDQIRVLDPAQAVFIENHLKTGLRFVWK